MVSAFEDSVLESGVLWQLKFLNHESEFSVAVFVSVGIHEKNI